MHRDGVSRGAASSDKISDVELNNSTERHIAKHFSFPRDKAQTC
jgi:hypothetical protein